MHLVMDRLCEALTAVDAELTAGLKVAPTVGVMLDRRRLQAVRRLVLHAQDVLAGGADLDAESGRALLRLLLPLFNRYIC